MHYVINDLFRTITLFEAKTEEADYKKLSDNSYEVSLEISAKKVQADSLGYENDIKINDWIYLGVYGEENDGKPNLLYYERHKIDAEKMEFSITVPEKPTKAGIDPLNILIDRHPDDNVKELKKES